MAAKTSHHPERGADPDAPDVHLARDGDLDAFGRLYSRHAPRINSLAEWMLGTTDTEDVIQDVFVRAWEKLSTFRGDAPFGAWLRRLAVNVLLRYRERTRTHEERFLPDDESLHSAAESGPAAIGACQGCPRVEAARGYAFRRASPEPRPKRQPM